MKVRIRLPVLAFLLVLLILPIRSIRADVSPRVVVSIKPVHSLVAGIMQGTVSPVLLMEGSESPHGFNLKPSHMRRLGEADLLIWVGPDVETPLSRLIDKRMFTAQVMRLTQLDGLSGLTPRLGKEWETRVADLIEPHPDDHAHSDDIDSHIWLSPDNAVLIVQRITDRLCDIDSANANQYRSNSRQLVERLHRLDDELSARLSPVHEVPYIVFHDAYHYLEQRYDLNAVGSVSVSPERQPGAHRIHELRDKIERLGARCVFTEPQFKPKLVQTLIEGTTARAGELDPLGSDLAAGPDAYFLLMRRLADSLVECLR